MTRPLIAVALVAALGGGLWLGRSSSTDEVRAEPTILVEPVEVARAERRARAPIAAPRPALPSRPAPRGLAADLVASDPAIRRAAVAEVARGDQPAPEILITASRDQDLDVARAALAGVGKLYAEGQLAPREMIALATDRGIPDRARGVALNALGTIANPDAAAVLVKLLATGTTFERRSAAALLGNQDVELAVPALIVALGDADEYVRGNAHESLRLRSRGRDFGTDAGAWQAWWRASR